MKTMRKTTEPPSNGRAYGRAIQGDGIARIERFMLSKAGELRIIRASFRRQPGISYIHPSALPRQLLNGSNVTPGAIIRGIVTAASKQASVCMAAGMKEPLALPADGLTLYMGGTGKSRPDQLVGRLMLGLDLLPEVQDEMRLIGSAAMRLCGHNLKLPDSGKERAGIVLGSIEQPRSAETAEVTHELLVNLQSLVSNVTLGPFGALSGVSDVYIRSGAPGE